VTVDDAATAAAVLKTYAGNPSTGDPRAD